ncbi:MAG: cytochrome c3 family protein, partial [Mailhella sp.]|nr:cytochrome c3 family protein [Mailhella sp.]
MAGYVLPWETAGSQPQKSLLQNSGGPVVFEHEKHVATGAQCIDCHHELSVSA